MPGGPAIPTIGLTLPSPVADPAAQRRADRTTAVYRAALQACGASVVALPPQEPPVSLEPLDGLLLAGGGDIDPAHFGEEPHAKLGPPDARRDRFELWLAREVLARGLPVLGICRGAQVLGVALGGQLVQDIDSEVERAQRHRAPEGERLPCHAVEVAAGSLLSRVVNASRLRVNSCHHQANRRLGPGVRRSAWAGDGVTEAIEFDGGRGFVLGVQWHPERMWRRAPRQRRLLEAFVEAAGGRHHSSRE